jgi:hypothetical protein
MSRDWVMCCSLWLLVFGILTVLPNSTYEAGIEWCAALLWFRVWKSIFQQSYPIPTYEAGIKVMCCSFVITCGIFQQSYPIPIELSDVLLFVIPCVSIFQQSYPIPTYEGLSDVLLFCDYIVLEYFSTVLPNSHLWSRIEWCAALLWLHVLEYFFNSPTQFTYKADWVMCCSFVITCVRVFF